MIELSHLAINSPVSYLVALLLPAFDALIPILPSETAIIGLGVATAGSTDPRIAVLVLLAALGAFIGDNVTYLVGRRLGPLIDRKVFAGEKGKRRRAWAEQALDRYGARIIVACRFVPGGRTAVTLVCGLIRYNRRTFIAATAVAGVIWACYAFFIGRLGGQAFEDRPWLGLILAFAVALAISGLIELGRRLWPRLRRRFGKAGTRGGGSGGGADRDGGDRDGAGEDKGGSRGRGGANRASGQNDGADDDGADDAGGGDGGTRPGAHQVTAARAERPPAS
jgi:membrane protein DedA with SNARE-associated domain